MNHELRSMWPLNENDTVPRAATEKKQRLQSLVNGVY